MQREPGDPPGAVAFLWIAWLGIRYGIAATTHDVPVEQLFVVEEAVVGGASGHGGGPYSGTPADGDGSSAYGSDHRPTDAD